MKQTRTRIHDCGDDLRHRIAAWGRDGFARLLRAEFTKFRTVRSWMIGLCAAAVVFVLLSFVSAFGSRAPVRAVPTGPGGAAVSDTYMFVPQTLAGDGTLTARAASPSAAHTTGTLLGGWCGRRPSWCASHENLPAAQRGNGRPRRAGLPPVAAARPGRRRHHRL